MVKIANVKIKETNEILKILIAPDLKPEITLEMKAKWQSILDNLSIGFNVPTITIMKISESKIKVFSLNRDNDGRFRQGDELELGSGMYCETVIGKNMIFAVENSQ